MINLTNKTIKFYAPEQTTHTPAGLMLRSEAEALNPILVLPSQGEVRPYSVITSEIIMGSPIVIQRYKSVDNPATHFPNDKQFIVSNLYASVARSLGLLDLELYTVYKLIRGVINGPKMFPRHEVGCLGLEAK
jgi:hypothetical protein